MTEAEQERAAVVAWLRRQAAAILALMEEAAFDESRDDLDLLAVSHELSAKAIERGDHLEGK